LSSFDLLAETLEFLFQFFPVDDAVGQLVLESGDTVVFLPDLSLKMFDSALLHRVASINFLDSSDPKLELGLKFFDIVVLLCITSVNFCDSIALLLKSEIFALDFSLQFFDSVLLYHIALVELGDSVAFLQQSVVLLFDLSLQIADCGVLHVNLSAQCLDIVIFLLNLHALVCQLLQIKLLAENQIYSLKQNVVERCLHEDGVLFINVLFDSLDELSDLRDLSS
jgi:hypothetical protein